MLLLKKPKIFLSDRVDFVFSIKGKKKLIKYNDEIKSVLFLLLESKELSKKHKDNIIKMIKQGYKYNLSYLRELCSYSYLFNFCIDNLSLFAHTTNVNNQKVYKYDNQVLNYVFSIYFENQVKEWAKETYREPFEQTLGFDKSGAYYFLNSEIKGFDSHLVLDMVYNQFKPELDINISLELPLYSEEFKQYMRKVKIDESFVSEVIPKVYDLMGDYVHLFLQHNPPNDIKLLDNKNHINHETVVQINSKLSSVPKEEGSNYYETFVNLVKQFLHYIIHLYRPLSEQKDIYDIALNNMINRYSLIGRTEHQLNPSQSYNVVLDYLYKQKQVFSDREFLCLAFFNGIYS